MECLTVRRGNTFLTSSTSGTWELIGPRCGSLAASPKGRCAVSSYRDMPLRVSVCRPCEGGCSVLWAAWEVVDGLDPQPGEVGMAGLTQPVIRGQSTAQGAILSGRNQSFWPLCFKGPLWCSRARMLTQGAQLSSSPRTQRQPICPEPLPQYKILLLSTTLTIGCSSG